MIVSVTKRQLLASSDKNYRVRCSNQILAFFEIMRDNHTMKISILICTILLTGCRLSVEPQIVATIETKEIAQIKTFEITCLTDHSNRFVSKEAYEGFNGIGPNSFIVTCYENPDLEESTK